MRIVHFEKRGVPGIAADEGSGWHGLTQTIGERFRSMPKVTMAKIGGRAWGGASEIGLAVDMVPARSLGTRLEIVVGAGYHP